MSHAPELREIAAASIMVYGAIQTGRIVLMVLSAMVLVAWLILVFTARRRRS